MNSIEIESAEYYLTAAEQGDVSAQFNLSVMYANGHGGLVQDFIFAHVWATRAALKGDKEASLLCDLLRVYSKTHNPKIKSPFVINFSGDVTFFFIILNNNLKNMLVQR